MSSAKLETEEFGDLRFGGALNEPNDLGPLLDGFRDYLLAIAGDELSPELRARFGPSDLVQDTFVQAKRAWHDFRGQSEAELRLWLRKILVRQCRDVRKAHLETYKRNPLRTRTVGSDALAARSDRAPAFDENTPSRYAIADEEANQVMEALNRLPEILQVVVWMRNWEALAFDEIGRRLNRSPDAARKLFVRAVDRLARELDTGHGSPHRPR